MSYLSSDCSCNSTWINSAVQCITCPSDVSFSKPDIDMIIQKRIQNQVRTPASLYTMNLGALSVAGSSNNAPLTGNVIWNQSSDRLVAANSKIPNPRTVPSGGNSTKRTLTSNRPGAAAPGGQGVDIKHNSYARRLARLKSKNLRTGSTSSTAVKGNKTKKYGMIANANCVCVPPS